MITLSNNQLTIKIADKGAELQSVLNTISGVEYMWQGDPAYWSKHSPVLFPIVGGLRNNVYEYEGKQYSLGRHGFARDMVFSVVSQDETSVTFAITDTAETLEKYPFFFQFSVKYVLDNTKLSITYGVQNTGDKTMYFSVGAHPAFRVPLVSSETFEDYFLEFNKEESAQIYPLDDNGQTLLESIPFFQNTNKLSLRKSLFYKDALVFKELQSDAISLRSQHSDYGLTVSFAGFPYMGIWNAKDADFVCIEPWKGIADNVQSSGKLQEKEGILSLDAAQKWEASWDITFF